MQQGAWKLKIDSKAHLLTGDGTLIDNHAAWHQARISDNWSHMFLVYQYFSPNLKEFAMSLSDLKYSKEDIHFRVPKKFKKGW